jgi:hypothetical protein
VPLCSVIQHTFTFDSRQLYFFCLKSVQDVLFSWDSHFDALADCGNHGILSLIMESGPIFAPLRGAVHKHLMGFLVVWMDRVIASLRRCVCLRVSVFTTIYSGSVMRSRRNRTLRVFASFAPSRGASLVASCGSGGQCDSCVVVMPDSIRLTSPLSYSCKCTFYCNTISKHLPTCSS